MLYDLVILSLSQFSEQLISAFTEILAPSYIESQAGELGSLASCMDNMIGIRTIFAKIGRAYPVFLVTPEVMPDRCDNRYVFAQRLIPERASASLAEHC